MKKKSVLKDGSILKLIDQAKNNLKKRKGELDKKQKELDLRESELEKRENELKKNIESFNTEVSELMLNFN